MRKEDTVKLISAEGFEFVIDKKAAMVSQTIRNMLTSPGSFAETQHGEVTFPEISTIILEKICQYFYWSLQYASGKETEIFSSWATNLVEHCTAKQFYCPRYRGINIAGKWVQISCSYNGNRFSEGTDVSKLE
ncbi:hypothetical protein U1Q18_041752 [Sarracenia purpurea var. burkii]